jgi:hypothetical protein
MVWHIFKKDWKLMWRSAAAVVALQLAYAFIQLEGEFGKGNPVLDEFHTMLMFLWLIAGMIWVVMLVHQDALPGTKQDWLTRPIRRTDVLVAKVMFAALVVQGSMVAGDLLQGLGSGFPLGQSLRAAMARAVIGFIAITIPALVIGALTQSIADAMILSAVFGFGIFVFTIMAIALGGGYEHQFDPTNASGVEWIPNLLRFLMVLVGGAIVMLAQYRTRKTRRGRIVMAAILLLMLCSQAIPWKPVFALEKKLSTQPSVGNEIGLAWQPHTVQTDNPISADRPEFGMVVGNHNPNDDVRLLLPVSVEGLPTDSVLKEDNAEMVLTDAGGKRLYAVDGGPIEIRREGSQSAPIAYDQAVKVPAQVYQDNKDRSVQVETTYSMTLFKLSESYSMTVGGDQLISASGHCESKINVAATAVEVRCMQMGKGPTCATVFLEDPRDGSHNRPITTCNPNYSPYVDRPIPDAVSHFRLVLPFRDPAGQMKYAVDVSKMDAAQIAIRVYEPADHFTRTVTSPLVTMKDLAVH